MARPPVRPFRPGAPLNASLTTFALLLALLGVSAFFAMSEAALFSLQRVDREALREDASIGETIRHLLAQPRRILAALLMGSETANIALSAAAADLSDRLAPSVPWVHIVLVAPLIILCADIIPKTLGIRFSRPSVTAR